MKQCETQSDLDTLYKRTNFTKKSPTWDRIKESNYPDSEPSIFIPQCSYLGNTMIMMADSCENGGEDGYFVQELIRLYREGKLSIKSQND